MEIFLVPTALYSPHTCLTPVEISKQTNSRQTRRICSGSSRRRGVCGLREQTRQHKQECNE